MDALISNNAEDATWIPARMGGGLQRVHIGFHLEPKNFGIAVILSQGVPTQRRALEVSDALNNQLGHYSLGGAG